MPPATHRLPGSPGGGSGGENSDGSHPLMLPSPPGNGRGPLAPLFRFFRRRPLTCAAAASVALFVVSSLPAGGVPAPLPHLDKAFHLGAYFLLGLTYLNVATRGWSSLTGWRLGLAWLAVAAFGASDEWYQSFVPGRSAELADVAADALGGALALGLAVYSGRRRRRGDT